MIIELIFLIAGSSVTVSSREIDNQLIEATVDIDTKHATLIAEELKTATEVQQSQSVSIVSSCIHQADRREHACCNAGTLIEMHFKCRDVSIFIFKICQRESIQVGVGQHRPFICIYSNTPEVVWRSSSTRLQCERCRAF